MAGTALMVDGRAAMRNGRAIMRTSSSTCCCGAPGCSCVAPCGVAAGYSYHYTKSGGQAPVAVIAPTVTPFCCLDTGLSFVFNFHDLHYKTDSGGGPLGCLVRDDTISYSGPAAPGGTNFVRHRIRRDPTTCAVTLDSTDTVTAGPQLCDSSNFNDSPYLPPHPWPHPLDSPGAPTTYGVIWGTPSDHYENTWVLTSLTGVGQVWRNRIYRYSRRAGVCYPSGCMIGGCCLPDGTCAETDPDTCFQLGGHHYGPGVPCAAGLCMGSGADFQFIGNTIGSGAFL